jgi:hypothetical protein
MRIDRGILFIAIGENWVSEVVGSAERLRRFLPGVPITVVSDRTFHSEHVDKVVVRDADEPPLLTRTRWLCDSPYEITLFLDTDVTVCGDISDMFALMDRFDLAVPHAPYRLDGMGLRGGLPGFLSKGVPECFPGLNPGVMIYKRTSAVQAFFREWLDYHEELCRSVPGAPSQPAFRTALYRSDLRFAVLPDEYHCRFVFPFKVCGAVKVLHGRHPDIDRVISAVNSSKLPRVGEGYLVERARHDAEHGGELDEPLHPGIPNGGVVTLL